MAIFFAISGKFGVLPAPQKNSRVAFLLLMMKGENESFVIRPPHEQGLLNKAGNVCPIKIKIVKNIARDKK